MTRIAAGLHHLGVVPGDVVGMQLPNWWEPLAVHYAVLLAGEVAGLEHVVTVRGRRERAIEFAELTASADGEAASPRRTADEPVVLP